MTEEKKSRAAVPPPRQPFLPKDVAGTAPANNMSGERLAPMTFNMPQDWHKRFKTTAVLHEMSMKDLLIESFAAWEREQKRRME